MNDDLDAQFDKKVRELLKQVDDSQKKNIYNQIHIVGDVIHHFYIIQKKVGL